MKTGVLEQQNRITNLTDSTTLTTSQLSGLTKFYNSAQAPITLPAAEVGLSGEFFINHSGGVRFIRNGTPGTDTFTCGGTASLTAMPVGGGYDIVVGGIYEITCYVTGVWTVRRKGVQPSFAAYMSAGMSSFTVSTDTLIAFDTEHRDNNNNYDNSASNYKYLPTIPGDYRTKLEVFGNVRPSETAYFIKLFKTGSQYKHLNAHNANAAYMVIPFTIACDSVTMNGSTSTLQPYINVGVTNSSIEVINSASSLFEATRISD